MELLAFVFGGFLSALMLIVSIVGAILILNIKSNAAQRSGTEKDNILSFIVKLICSLSLFLWLSISHAEDLGRYISSEPIKLNDDLTIEAGVTVNFLGVLDVPKNVASSGRLATFYVGENIYNADAALFTRQLKMPIWLFYRPRWRIT